MELTKAIEELKNSLLERLRDWPPIAAIGHGQVLIQIHEGRISHVEITLKDRPESNNRK